MLIKCSSIGFFVVIIFFVYLHSVGFRIDVCVTEIFLCIPDSYKPSNYNTSRNKMVFVVVCVTLRLKCDGTCAETRFRLSAKRTSPYKAARASVRSTTGSRGARISSSNAGYTMFRGSVKGTGYPLHSPVSPSLPLPCVTVCHHI
jgi:hypothetical protein